MWFQKFLSLLLIIGIIWGAAKMLNLGKYIKVEDDIGEEEVSPEQSELEKKILELHNKSLELQDLAQNIDVTKEIKDIDKQMSLLTKKLDRLN